MSQAIKLHVTEMGDDPRNNVLYAFGGAGPLHAYDICEKLGRIKETKDFKDLESKHNKILDYYFNKRKQDNVITI